MRSHTKAGLLYLLPAGAVVVVWYLMLFGVDMTSVVPNRTLPSVLSEGPRPWWFRWLFVLPFLCLGLAGAYCSRFATRKTGALVLLAIGSALALATWLTVTSEIALCTTLPLAYGVLVAHESLGLGEERG